MVKQPLLAYQKLPSPADLAPHLPLLGSIKLDGIRGINEDGLVSRNWISIPSRFAQNMFSSRQYASLDGELIATYREEDETVYHASHSACMTHGDMRELQWHVFDVLMAGPYQYRLAKLTERLAQFPHPGIHLVQQKLLHTYDDILEYEAFALGEMKAEGLILRRADAPYKYGRSTLKQGYLLKFVRWEYGEAEVIGFEEEEHNANEARPDAFGRIKRSSHLANRHGKGRLGSFIARESKTGVVFNIGSGPLLTGARRLEIWNNRAKYLGRLVKYKHKPYGMKDKPRHPVAEGWRSPIDM